MDMVPVESSNVAKVGYDPNSQVLVVEFRSGTVYQYFDVPQHVFDGLIAAESKGQFLNAQVKGVYRFARA